MWLSNNLLKHARFGLMSLFLQEEAGVDSRNVR